MMIRKQASTFKSFLPYVPELCADETAESFFGGWYGRSGFRDFDLFIRCATGQNLNFGFLNFGGGVEIRSRAVTRLTAQAMADQLTLQEFTKHFQCSSGQLYSSMKKTAALRIIQEPRRYCMECAQASLWSIGRAVWRRTHALPGVTVCKLHQSRLQVDSEGDPTLSPLQLRGLRRAPRASTPFAEWYAEQASALLNIESVGDLAIRRAAKRAFRSLDPARVLATELPDWLDKRILEVCGSTELEFLSLGQNTRRRSYRNMTSERAGFLNPRFFICVVRALDFPNVTDFLRFSEMLRDRKPMPDIWRRYVVEAKFRKPDSFYTWNGLGRPPDWVAGLDYADFAV